jgi:hypothetical protein
MHKFKIGQSVRFEPNTWHFRNSVPGAYEVMQQLPERNGEFEYRVKGSNEAHERGIHPTSTPSGPASAIGSDQAATARRAACQFHGRRSAILFAG